MTESSENLRPRVTLDVSHLKTSAWDSHEPAWWGNLLLTLIETTTLVIVLASYLYLHHNFGQWPPPRINEQPVIANPNPDLLLGTLNLLFLGASCFPMYWNDMAARRKDRRAVRGWLLLMLAICLVSIVIRFYEFPHFHFRWDENAYGSLVWWILGLHLTYLLGAAGEFFIMWLWVMLHKLDDHHALDITLAGGYWYWVAGTWAVIWMVIYIGPRMF